MKKVRALIGASAASGALIVGLAAPATAHTANEAILYGCGSGYSLVNDGTRAVTTTSGSIWGYVHLTYNSSNGYNCVVTRKTAYHGTPSRVRAELTVQNVGTYTNIDNAASHWESVQAYGRGHCVQYFGWVWNPQLTTLAAGGRTYWGNCG